MTNSKSTKRALLLSALSLLMCVAMLVGTTFAWFTDTASAGINKIVSGTLDMEVYHKVGNELALIDGATDLFSNVNGEAILWEPGATAKETFVIKNVGNLAFKFLFTLNYANATETADGHTLAEVLTCGLGDSVSSEPITSLENISGEYHLLPQTEMELPVYIKWEPTDHDNDYNVAGGLSIDLGVKVVATQDTVEYDSNNNRYDEAAEYERDYGLRWSGEAAPLTRDDSTPANVKTLADVTDTTAKTVKIDSPELLAAFGKSLNDGSDYDYFKYTVYLEEDINLDNIDWTPIGTSSSPFQGTFDGQGHTISNLKITSGENVGLFGHITLANNVKNPTNDTTKYNYTPGIKDLTLNNVTITADNSGAFLGNANTTTRNAGNGGALQLIGLALTGKVTIEGKNVGGIIGTEWTDFQIYADNITVDVSADSYVKGTGVIGGVFASTPHGSVNNITSNMNVIARGDNTGAVAAGGIVGCAGWTLSDVTCTGNVVVTNVAITANNKYQIGKIVGKEANNPYWGYYGNTTKKYGSEFKNFTANNTIGITLTDNTVLTQNGLTSADKKGSLNLIDYDQSLVGSAIWDWLW